MSSTPASTVGWLPTMPTTAVEAGEAAHDVARPRAGSTSKKSPSSTISAMTSFMSYGWLGRRGQIVSSASARRSPGRRSARSAAGLRGCSTAGTTAGSAPARGTVCSSSARTCATPTSRVASRAAELLLRDLFAGDRLHDVGAGDEHVRRALHHEDEVGHARASRPRRRRTGRGSRRSAG